MSSGNVLDQTSTATTGSSPTNGNNINPNNNNTANNNSTAFQAVRSNPENIGHPFENPMQMFAMKQQQPLTSPVTGTIYTGPPAKYLSNGGMNSNGYAQSGPMRPMIPQQQQQQNRYGSYNGNNNNNNNSGSAMQQQQRRQNNSGVDNATNDSVK
jgi:hypothetical protein